MTNKEKAITITQSYIKGKAEYEGFVVNSDHIVERETLWYVPFKASNTEINGCFGGAYNGLIVDKYSTEYMQPGSVLELQEWIEGFEMGLRGEHYDLLIDKVNDYEKTLEALLQMSLSYVVIEEEADKEWKIPKEFSKKDIQRRLTTLPCAFKNQAFSFCIQTFKKVRAENLFQYQLLKTENTDPKILGELISF
jgi:hypothetical protein